MGIQTNSSEEAVTGGGGIPLYTGIAAMNVIAVNPTLEELNDLGIPLKTEPEYTNLDIKGDTFNKITFWLSKDDPSFNTRFDILVKPEPKVSSTGKNMWINNFGRTVYCQDKPSETYDWYKGDGERHSFHGEDKLMNFVLAWGNVSNNAECYFDTYKDIMNGKVDEIKALADNIKDNKVRVLLGVRDGKYQQIYNKHFGRNKPQRNDLFVKELNKDFGAFNAEYSADLEFRKYEPELVVPDSAIPEENIKVESSEWSSF
jgi:hypothetical protein